MSSRSRSFHWAFVLAVVICLGWPMQARPAAAQGTRSQAAFDPAIEGVLLENGYTRNILDVGGLRVLRASQQNYTNTTWSRDLDYAMSGYAYALHDTSVL